MIFRSTKNKNKNTLIDYHFYILPLKNKFNQWRSLVCLQRSQKSCADGGSTICYIVHLHSCLLLTYKLYDACIILYIAVVLQRTVILWISRRSRTKTKTSKELNDTDRNVSTNTSPQCNNISSGSMVVNSTWRVPSDFELCSPIFKSNYRKNAKYYTPTIR